MISRPEAEKILRRLFNGGVIERLPKKQSDAELLMALAASVLDPRHRYTEQEVNEALMDWLDGFTCPIGMDHVTFRRFLVDFSFLLRDASGSYYTANQSVITSMIEPDVRSIQPVEIYDEVQSERARRKRENATS